MILGCTGIPLLVKQQDVSVPVFDSMAIHTGAAVDFALGTARTATPVMHGDMSR